METNLLVNLYWNLYSTDLYLLGKPEELDHLLKCFNKPVRVLGSCNGLLCLSNSDEDVLWNMSTRKYHLLPPMPDKHQHRYIDSLYGFAPDSINDDYKVLRIVQLISSHGPVEPEVTVYSLRTNLWTTTQLDFHFPYESITGYERIGIHSNSALHWMVSKELEYPRLAIAFDLALEECRMVSLPDNIRAHQLGVLGGCLCVTEHYKKYVCVDIWVMNVYGVMKVYHCNN